MSRESNLLARLILGLAVGAIGGLLLAPNSGKETREFIKLKAKNFKEEIDKKLDALDSSSLDDLKESFRHVKDEASAEYQKIAQKVRDLEKEIEKKIKALRKQANKLNSETT